MSDWDSWNQQQRVNQERWDYATSSGQYAPPNAESQNWSSPSPGTYSGGGSTSGYAGSGGWSTSRPTFLSIIPWIPALVVLYPLPFAAAFAASGVGYGMIEAAADARSATAYNWVAAGAVLAGVAVFFSLSRVEHRLAASPLWRIPRHLYRLTAVALLADQIAAWALLPPARFEQLAIVHTELVVNPIYLAAVVIAPLLAHVALTRPRLREWWYERLEAAHLKKAR